MSQLGLPVDPLEEGKARSSLGSKRGSDQRVDEQEFMSPMQQQRINEQQRSPSIASALRRLDIEEQSEGQSNQNVGLDEPNVLPDPNVVDMDADHPDADHPDDQAEEEAGEASQIEDLVDANMVEEQVVQQQPQVELDHLDLRQPMQPQPLAH